MSSLNLNTLLYPSHIEQKIGFDKIRELIKKKCLGSLGSKQVDSMQFSTSFTEVHEMLQLTKEAKDILLFEESFPISGYGDLTDCINRIRIEGTWIQLSELTDLRRSLIAIYAIISFFKNKDENLYPNLRTLAGNIEIHKIIIDRINTILDQNGKIKDNATPELAFIRQSINSKRAEVNKIMLRLLKDAKNEGWAESDTELSLRDGRLVIPINASAKRKVKGFIHDESATGKTSFIEPAEAFDKNNEITELEFEEQREIIKILTLCTDFIRPYRDDIRTSFQFLGTIDFLLAKAHFAIEIQAHAPVLVEEQTIRLYNANHPLLYLSHKKDNKTVVSQNMVFSNNQRILVISGPNAGGKSVCLKMVGLLQYMLQCGLLIPAKESSECSIFENIFIDIGDEQSIENDLSTYSSHLKNMKFFIENCNDKTIILIDEFGAGTEPLLGGAIAEAVLDNLNHNHCFGVVNTHYTNLKHFANQTDGIVNGAMLYDSENMKPLYKLQIGAPGSSFAFEIAKNLGFPEHILQKASDKIGQKHIDFDKSLKDMEREKQFLARKRSEIEEKEIHLREVLDRYNSKLESINQKKKEILDTAHSEAKSLLNSTNKVIENTIRQIKESNAEKEATRAARQNLELFKQETEEKQQTEEERIQRKIEQIRQKQERRKNKSNKSTSATSVKTFTPIPLQQEIIIGSKVQMKGQTAVGEVLHIEGNNITVSFGSLKTNTKRDNLNVISETDYKKAIRTPQSSHKTQSNFDMMEKRLNFKSEIDVRGKRADEALQLVSEFVEQAIVLNINQIQILHGKGDGILRSQIRTYLKTVPEIAHFSDAHIELGGAGITVIEIE